MIGRDRGGFLVIVTCIVGLSLTIMLLSDTTAADSNSENLVDKSSSSSQPRESEAQSSSSTSTSIGSSTYESSSKYESTCEKNIDHRNEELLLYHFSSANSTQDEARKIIEDKDNMIPKGVSAIAVTATEQTKGRGTNGRAWIGAEGNTFVTICIKQNDWMSTKIPLTLLPLKIGSIIAQELVELFQSLKCSVSSGPNPSPKNNNSNNNTPEDNEEKIQIKVKWPNDELVNTVSSGTTEDNEETIEIKVKWPNDVLVNNDKIAGVLIETATAPGYEYWFMIGIGVNVMYAPDIPTSGPNHGRKATCVRHHCRNVAREGTTIAKELGVDMAYSFTNWLHHQQQQATITTTTTATVTSDLISEWKKWVDWNMPLILRDSDDKDPVLPVGVEMDGRLRVQSQKAAMEGRGKKTERLVVADYFI